MVINYVILNIVMLFGHCIAIYALRFINPAYRLFKAVEKHEQQKDETDSEADSEADRYFADKKFICCIKKNSVYICAMVFLDVALMNFVQFFYSNAFVFNIELCVLLALLWTVAYIDYQTKRIPNDILIILLIIRGLLFVFDFVFLEDPIQKMISTIIAVAVVFIACMICCLLMKNSIGSGDVKLLMIMSLYLGLTGIGITVLYMLLVSFVIAVKLLITKKVSRKDYIPFAPSILIGTILSIFTTGI